MTRCVLTSFFTDKTQSLTPFLLTEILEMKYPTLHWYSTSNSSRSSNWQSIGGSITDFLLEPFTTTAHFYIAFNACSQYFFSSELITLILSSISWSLSIKFFEAQIPMLFSNRYVLLFMLEILVFHLCQLSYIEANTHDATSAEL